MPSVHPTSRAKPCHALSAIRCLIGLAALLGGCDPGEAPIIDGGPRDAAPDLHWLPPPGPPRGFAPQPVPAPATVQPAVPRVVAIGDIHGDLAAARGALITAGVIDDAGHWIGGHTVAVQVGDQLDRGDDERIILDWFERLRVEAAAAGGAFHPLIGNHEAMNVYGNLSYVTPGGFAAFADIPGEQPPERLQRPEAERGRVVAFAPGGPYARVLAEHNLTVQVGDTVFVHGGLTPEHVEYGLDRLNQETRAWMRGDAPEPLLVGRATGPLWIRTYGYDPSPEQCALLDATLAAASARRLVVAHTVQVGINSACDGRVWRVDVGLSAYYGGPMEALEITGDAVRVLGRDRE